MLDRLPHICVGSEGCSCRNLVERNPYIDGHSPAFLVLDGRNRTKGKRSFGKSIVHLRFFKLIRFSGCVQLILAFIKRDLLDLDVNNIARGIIVHQIDDRTEGKVMLLQSRIYAADAGVKAVVRDAGNVCLYKVSDLCLLASICVLAEVQPKGSSSKSEGDESPYVIIRALEDGNLFGLELFCAKKQRTYALPKVEVKAGEEVTLHLRNTKDIDACKSELGNDLALAKTRRSSNSKRDIFFEQGVPLDEANDVILLRQRNSNKAVDALSYFTTKDNATDWNLPESAQKAVKDGAWQGPGSVESAFLANDGKNKYTTSQPMVRSIFPSAKDRRPSSKYDWSISAQSVYAKR